MATCQLRLKDGTVHKHGPRDNPCQGSHKPPLGNSFQTLAGTSATAGAGASASLCDAPASAADSVTNSASRADSVCSRAGSAIYTSGPSLVSFQSLAWSPAGISVIKHIPKSARPACASHFAKILRAIVSKLDDSCNWFSLFNWSVSILQPPKHIGKRHNLTKTIQKRIEVFTSSQVLPPETVSRRAGSSTQMVQAVASKLEDGNIRTAIRILCSNDAPAPPTLENLNKLREIHPTATDTGQPVPDPLQYSPLSVAESDLLKAIQSFPVG